MTNKLNIRGSLGVIFGVTIASYFAAWTPAEGYKVRPYPGIHEAITLLAQQCVLESAPNPPEDCRRFAPMIGRLAGRRDEATYGDLQLGVRWPDDPARQVGTAGSIPFVVNMLGNCERLANREPTPRLDTIGILCSSHYGRLQFFHAMASVRGERTEDTRAKILEWADLTFQLATNRLRGNVNMCEHFRANHGEIAWAFELADQAHCDPGSEHPWTLSTLFNWRCGNSTMGRCDQILGLETRDVLAATIAQGALLHMVQDSYSESHADRGATGPFRSRVGCRLPTRFYNYLGQSGHAAADYVPIYADSCTRGGNAHDVITASAMAIYHMGRRSSPGDFSDYLQDHVFGRRVPADRRGAP